MAIQIKLPNWRVRQAVLKNVDLFNINLFGGIITNFTEEEDIISVSTDPLATSSADKYFSINEMHITLPDLPYHANGVYYLLLFGKPINTSK